MEDADDDVAVVVGEGSVGVDEDGEGGRQVMGESCRCSSSSHSPLSSSALKTTHCQLGNAN